MSISRLITIAAIGMAALTSVANSVASAQSTDALYAEMHWREIGPTRAGRARALSGVASQPNVFYVGYDNGGVWRSTDYGSNWVPLFDSEPTGSIGAIAVAPSDPNIIYVGTGAGIIRPDLSVGDGMYKSTDAGKTWTHLGLRDSQMIANIEVDPTNPNRLFVAVLGHPYGPNAERGIFRSTDGGKTFEKVLYKDEYVSGNDVRIDPKNPNIVYAALWQQQQSYIEGAEFGGTEGGIFKSTDGGTTWKQLTNGLPAGVIEANLGVSMSAPSTIYAMVAGTSGSATPARGGTTGTIGFYKSTDAGEHWTLAARDANNPGASSNAVLDPRPLVRIGGGDLPTIAVDPKNPNVVYSASTVFWRTEDGGVTWSAVRGAPGGDDYQKAWVNPNDTNILLVVADQGAIVSGNRGVSWSNWYNQPTAAMYHVSTDDAFPYRVCGGQQDSGSACVDSRSMDGEITFHDWHPVNIQEYGVAASDPKDPDLVFGSQRTNISLYNRRTGQTTNVGPDAEARGTEFGRNVRTMPIMWSPVNHNVLFYTSNVVWKSTDQAHSWTRISPDLARQTWAVPATVGKYSSSVKPAPQGSITALSASPRDVNVIWAGTDDGNIQVTTNGGAKWTNVTPAQIKPWTRIFNIDAGHFDTQTAYAAANTMRIDDLNPHLWRTHDGGKTWTEIDNGIAPGAATNSIREDPHKKGLLYASTETQVWVSFDDGDHWQSLRLDMPAVSVRDIQIKDDSICMCSDLIAGTHGRGFYILDDVTPLRQAAEARSANGAYLFKPQTALRIRLATNDPTPWPPELPAGENPPNGAIIDYYLSSNVSGPVTIDILDASNKVVRTYTSELKRDPDPGVDRAAYDKVCKANPESPDCDVPLYWPSRIKSMPTSAGMHRISWNMRYQPLATERGGVDATGAVPNRSSPSPSSPWAPPGQYTVRLTVAGKSYTQPLTVRLDPRVKTSPSALAENTKLSLEMYELARTTRMAYGQAHDLGEKVGQLVKEQNVDGAFKTELDSVAPDEARGGRRFFGRGGGRPSVTLNAASSAALAASLSMQAAETAPTAAQIAACARARVQAAAAMAHWNTLKTTGLSSFNALLKTKGQPALTLPALRLPAALPSDENGNVNEKENEG
ncbi:MAG: glycoside hydrolase [Gemmatimonadota bacterium]